MDGFKMMQVAAISAFNKCTFDVQQMELKEDMEYEMQMKKFIKEQKEYENAMDKYEKEMEEYRKANPEEEIHIARPKSPIFHTGKKRTVNPHAMIPDEANISIGVENKRANLITKLFGL
jgi:hypothetical protein